MPLNTDAIAKSGASPARSLFSSHGQPEERIRTRLLQAILLMSAALDFLFLFWILPTVYGLSTVLFHHPEWWSSLVSLLVSLGLFAVSRSGRTRLAASLFVGFSFVAVWSIMTAMVHQTSDPRELAWILSLLILSQMFGGLLLEFRSNVVLAAGHIVGLVSLPLLVHGIPLVQMFGISVLFGFAVALSTMTGLLHQLDLLEIVSSRQRLERSVEELREEISARESAESRKKELEEALLRTQRMEAVARLSGGFAHDFNNALMGVLGQLERIRSESEIAHRDLVDTAIGSVQRASDLIRGMLSLTHPQEGIFQQTPSDLEDILKEGFSMARGAISREIEIQLDLEPDVWVLADRGQIVQVLLNLCLNARDALESKTFEQDGPRIRLSMGTAAEGPSERNAGGFAWIEVEDNGPGIDDALKDKVFDPYFTTKGIGKGSGLGLWMCDAVARGLGGQIHLENSETGGARFRMLLPSCDHPSGKAPSEFPVPPHHQRTRKPWVLLVDDDGTVRENMSLALENEGWKVAQASDGPSAIEKFKEDPQRWRILILDLSLPGLPGREVLKSIRELRQDLPVLVVSGYDLGAGEAVPSVDGAEGRLVKPFLTSTLVREVRKLASGKGSRS